ncbi:uncharacterized protein LOC124257655 [Haliotis rubra]|uniref:uncharacterized protein LOC124257655 n=1 Tax=Haliotis rubra TaxID=36100 RepID=UPI001EE4F429|nr:uncharacterized protein LOC124257655 [Haliotis rubra]
MVTVEAVSQGFLTFCSAMSQTVATVCEIVHYVVYTNYQVMSTVCHYASLIVTTLAWALERIICGTMDVGHHIFDFATDLFGCFCTLCALIWRILLLLYKVVCFVLTGIETIAVCIWTGSYVTLTTLKHSATDVIETCGSTWNYGIDMSKNFVDTIFGGFSMIGTLTVSIVKGVFSGLGYGFASLLECAWKFRDKLCNAWDNVTTNLSETFTFSKEVYLGILLCCILYVIISELFKFFQNRGFSFLSWWRRRVRRHPRRPHNLYDIDNDFESDYEFDDQDYESEENEYISDDNDTLTGGSDDEDGSDVDSDGDDEDDDESEGSLNSQTFSSDDSDHEIEVELPAPSERYSLRSRSSTPSRAQKLEMSTQDFEMEIEREKDKRKCVVCQDQTKSVLILPCRHMCLCVDCANRIVRSRLIERRVCPLCRQRIQKVMDVFV